MCKKKVLKTFQQPYAFGERFTYIPMSCSYPISLVGSSYPEQPPSLLGDAIPIFQCRSKIIQQVAMELHKHSCSRNQRLPISHKHPLTTPDTEQTSLTDRWRIFWSCHSDDSFSIFTLPGFF